MSLLVARWLAGLLALYVLLGLLFALPFVFKRINTIDPLAARGTWGFRLLMIPGSVALWPWLLKRWLSNASAPPEESTPHRTAARRHAS